MGFRNLFLHTLSNCVVVYTCVSTDRLIRVNVNYGTSRFRQILVNKLAEISLANEAYTDRAFFLTHPVKAILTRNLSNLILLKGTDRKQSFAQNIRTYLGQKKRLIFELVIRFQKSVFLNT